MMFFRWKPSKFVIIMKFYLFRDFLRISHHPETNENSIVSHGFKRFGAIPICAVIGLPEFLYTMTLRARHYYLHP